MKWKEGGRDDPPQWSERERLDNSSTHERIAVGLMKCNDLI